MYGLVWSVPDDGNLHLVFEFMDREKLRYTIQLIEALVCLHEASIIHRDVKSKHVLLHSSGDAKLTDFGWSREMDVQVLLTHGAGSFRWSAPEILETPKPQQTIYAV
ncbi:hypothetical protein H257_08622 [Aphanomyces astaci]|uniref:mitogen-activated protein kinase kinase n=1 Tax=Aphanomyces astaci TaxID=112090 RepID=W4GFN4_APHAT|nr:hypothetical protein H257_08622 [Aphanomyces astaci]ETV77778.1 hypothetical protein H257_08622 [Aphanomyces astaci]|eukprot:XP_009832888.1 hypothetical protein H257_08622 [Aphanomyces astaci]